MGLELLSACLIGAMGPIGRDDVRIRSLKTLSSAYPPARPASYDVEEDYTAPLERTAER